MVKRCPTCQRTFTDANLTFCVDDGTPLVAEQDEEATIVNPSRSKPPEYQPPSYVPPGSRGQARSRSWPWILVLLVVFVLIIGGLAIGAAIFIPRALRASTNKNLNFNANTNRGFSPNVNSQNANVPDANINANSNSDNDNNTPAPSNHDAVLADLKNLEDEWTVANINADKKKLDSILADDYVGTTEGRSQGKAEYLKTIQRDTSIQHWEFQDLKLTLNSGRASLTGVLEVNASDETGRTQDRFFHFTDKFVWRDGRWQATSSEVQEMKEGINTEGGLKHQSFS